MTSIIDMPFTKVDIERRTVAGFATLNNRDKQKDRVDIDASIEAFKSFAGNVREQHSKIAAGRMLEYSIQKRHDPKTNEVYDGIYVKVYVSKGAESTWIKVLDKTLNGFSIGGNILDYEMVTESDGEKIRVIKKYELGELSLVDNPANTLSDIMYIEKTYVTGKELNSVADSDTEGAEQSVTASESGTIIVGDEKPETDVVENKSSDTSTSTAAVETPEVAPKPNVDTTTVVSQDTTQGSNDAAVLAAAINEIRTLIEGKETKTGEIFADIVAQLKELRTTIDTTNTGVADANKELASVKSTVAEFDKRVQAVEADTAVRKSGDLGEVVQEPKIEKSIWGGRFLSFADL